MLTSHRRPSSIGAFHDTDDEIQRDYNVVEYFVAYL